MIEVEKVEEQIEKVLNTTPVNKAQEMMKSRSGLKLIAFISFIESSLPVPLLTDPFMVAAQLLDRANSLRIVLVTIFFSVLGGIAAYFSAVLFLESLLEWMTPGMLAQFQELMSSNEGNVFVLTILGAITPVPYTFVAWSIAVLEGSLFMFILASTLGRTIRYGIVGYCAYKFGPMAVTYAKKYLALTSVLVFVLAAIYVWLKL